MVSQAREGRLKGDNEGVLEAHRDWFEAFQAGNSGQDGEVELTYVYAHLHMLRCTYVISDLKVHISLSVAPNITRKTP